MKHNSLFPESASDWLISPARDPTYSFSSLSLRSSSSLSAVPLRMARARASLSRCFSSSWACRSFSASSAWKQREYQDSSYRISHLNLGSSIRISEDYNINIKGNVIFFFYKFVLGINNSQYRKEEGENLWYRTFPGGYSPTLTKWQGIRIYLKLTFLSL